MPPEGFTSAGRTRPAPNVHGPRTGPPPHGSRPGSSRRPRWDTDAGITERDVAALRWLGQQYAARSDVLRVLLGRLSPGSPRIAGQLGNETLRQILDRWDERGLIVRDRLLGFQWVAPHRQGAAPGRPGGACLVVRHPTTGPRARRRRGPPRPGARHSRGWPLAQRTRAAPGGRQKPRPRRRHPAPRQPPRRGRVGPVRRGRRPAAPSDRCRG
jgi:hypothetical protein